MAEALVEAFAKSPDPADALESVTLLPSSGGVFEVTVDDRLVYSKRATGKHVTPSEVVALIHERPR
ncbi:MAG: Rdx family protein [Fimbriimonadaceae bacterium]|nr:Rdx family protein [Fimbriimonadaceae bacterium]